MSLKRSLASIAAAVLIAAAAHPSIDAAPQRRGVVRRGDAAHGQAGPRASGQQERPPARRGQRGLRRDARPVDRAMGRRAGRGAVLARALETVGLSSEQRRQLGAIRGRHDDRVRGIGRRLISSQRQIEAHLFGAVPDLERARGLARERSALLAERERSRTEVELEVFKILTPDQRTRLRELRAEAARPGQREGARPRGREARMRRRQETGRPVAPIRQIGLSADQVSRLRSMRQRRMAELRELTITMRETQRAIDDAMLSQAIDEAAVRRYAAELGRVEGERSLLRFEIEAELQSVLTREQAQRLRELRLQRRSRPPARTDADDGDEAGDPGDLDTPSEPVL